MMSIIGCNHSVSVENIVALLSQGNGLSVLKGAATELLFLSDMERQGMLWCRRIADNDKKERFDWEVVFDGPTALSFEVKKPYKRQASIDFRDAREILLPSGHVWKTHCRHKDERFDYLACPLVEQKKVLYISFEQIPFVEPVGRRFRHWRQQDREFVRENYLQNKVTIEI